MEGSNAENNQNSFVALKEKGNKFFKDGDFASALAEYTKALKITENGDDQAVILNNRAAANLKLERFEEVVKDASAALEKKPADVKAMFRRSQAYEKLGKVDDAFKDAQNILHLEPKNTAVQPLLQRLSQRLQEIAKEQASTINKVNQMLGYISEETTTHEKKIQACNNLIILAREKAGAELIIKSSGVPQLVRAMKKLKNQEFSLASIRIFSELSKNSDERAVSVLQEIGLPVLIDHFIANNEEYITAVQYLFQMFINALSGMDTKENKKPKKELLEKNEKEIDTIMMTLTKSVSSRVMSGVGRDAILELIMKNAAYENLNWGMKLVDKGGLYNLLDVASELQDVKYESSMNITKNTPANVSACLDRVFFCHDYDKARENFREKMMEFINEKLRSPDVESKVRAAVTITALLRGPLDAGNMCLSQQGVIEMMLVMAGTDDEVQQKVAAEAIIAAASKKDKCSSMASMGTGILKKLYQSKIDSIKVRALVGLCKIGSLGGTDCTMKPFSDGSSLKLANSCRKFLVNPSKNRDLRKWAAEGLSYLTLDADVKEDLITDSPALISLIDLAKTEELAVLYGVLTTLVNLTNSYDKQEIIPEMIELAKFAKQHVPEEHALDAKEYVQNRIKILGESGVTYALVALSKTDSKNSRELISRVFNAVCEQQDLRGFVVQQGGAKALINLAKENTDKGKICAAQALARIGITINPETAFPGQRAMEVVRPLQSLLHPERSGLENFEALMALTNLACISESVRKQIMKESGVLNIENYMYEDHPMLRRAGVQCVLNLLQSDDVIHLYEKGDRVKFLTLLFDEEDFETAKAAAGAIAILTSVSETACKKVVAVKEWDALIGGLASNENEELRYRGICILYNLVASCKEVAEAIIGTALLEVLMAITQLGDAAISDKMRKLADETLKKAEEWKLIKPTEDNPAEQTDVIEPE